MWIYAVSLRKKAYPTYQERGKKKKKKTKREERTEKEEVGWVMGGAHRAPAWRGGLLVEHMNPLTCKLLVAMN